MNLSSRWHWIIIRLFILTLLGIGGPATAGASEPKSTASSPDTDYEPAVEQLTRLIQDELQRGILTGVSVALVDERRVVLSEGFGLADKEQEIEATADTVYRVGSLSKLFTALAVMQLAEHDRIDIDAPISDYLPDFRIVIPFEDARPMTLRQLMCHRSGMVRESPVGGYLDGSGPGIAASVASLEPCVLVNPPNTKTRYSNIGVTLVGQTVAAVSGQSFEQYQKEHLLGPIGMTRSGWQADGPVLEQLAKGYMRVADGHGGFSHRQAPAFELGTLPAGNLYSNAVDMARFAVMLLSGGETPAGPIISAGTLASMGTPQLTDQKTGFGLGFFVGQHAGQRTMQHTGAVYGFSTSIVVLPTQGIAVVVLANEDIASGPVKRISEAALGWMLEAKTGSEPPEPLPTESMGTEELSAFVGDYESSGYWATIRLESDHLTADISGQPMTMRPVGRLQFEASGRWTDRSTVEFSLDEQEQVTSFTAFGQRFSRAETDAPSIPSAWQSYLGSYGPAYIPLVVSVRHGHLYAMTENMVDYRLTPVNQTVFKMPEGLYADEYLVFQVNPSGLAYSVNLANMQLPRRP